MDDIDSWRTAQFGLGWILNDSKKRSIREYVSSFGDILNSRSAEISGSLLWVECLRLSCQPSPTGRRGAASSPIAFSIYIEGEGEGERLGSFSFSQKSIVDGKTDKAALGRFPLMVNWTSGLTS